MKLILNLDFRIREDIWKKILPDIGPHARYLSSLDEKWTDSQKDLMKIDEKHCVADAIIAKDGETFCDFKVFENEEFFDNWINAKIEFMKDMYSPPVTIGDFLIDFPFKIVGLQTNLNNFKETLAKYETFVTDSSVVSHDFEVLIDHFLKNYHGIKREYFDQLM